MMTPFVMLGEGNDSQLNISFDPPCVGWDWKLSVNCIMNCIAMGFEWLEL